MAGKAAAATAARWAEGYPWKEKLAKYKGELGKGVWGYWELGAWKPLLPCSPNPKLDRRHRVEAACQHATELLLRPLPPRRCPDLRRYVLGVYRPSLSGMCDSRFHNMDHHHGNCSPASRNHRGPPLPVV
uniref:Uncharacterized protein n=1 Tax=Zea mays TaxID=4577 RepID=B6UA68_MAIZE|nr:hypothetical protein [Zea mays]